MIGDLNRALTGIAASRARWRTRSPTSAYFGLAAQNGLLDIAPGHRG
eukprot:SAG22_NODE_8838_length_626_cov_3.094877_2_plen_47_part_00